MTNFEAFALGMSVVALAVLGALAGALSRIARQAEAVRVELADLGLKLSIIAGKIQYPSTDPAISEACRMVTKVLKADENRRFIETLGQAGKN